MNSRRGHLGAALALLRLQLLPSALADIFAGAALAGGLSARHGIALTLFLTLLGSACLYLGGMVMNDVADATRDRDLSPSRPIPKGQITRAMATLLALALLLAAVLLLPMNRFHALPTAMVIGILLYDFVGNRHPCLGAPLCGKPSDRLPHVCTDEQCRAARRLRPCLRHLHCGDRPARQSRR